MRPHVARSGLSNTPERARALHEISLDESHRLELGIEEIDRVLGGGLVEGSALLLGGDPGIGKSTLLMQIGAALRTRGERVLYATSEESAAQVRMRMERLSLADDSIGEDQSKADFYVLAETDLGHILDEALRLKPAVLMLDSIQMVWMAGYGPGSGGAGAAGSASQLRRCAAEVSSFAKKTGITVILVGHVTKDGHLAGPKLLEHLVDVVLAFEGDQLHRHRILRGLKNRYGSTQEIGLFEMTAEGLKPVAEHSARLDGGGPAAAGVAIVPTMAGSRCLLGEIQALTAPGFPGSAKRRASGIDGARLAMLIAVLEKHAELRLADQDIFCSVAGGLRVAEPGADLAIALAIAGAHFNRALSPGTAVFGELTLSGAVRATTAAPQRLSEALRRGAEYLIVPAMQMDELCAAGSDNAKRLLPVSRLEDAMVHLAPVARTVQEAR